MRQVVLDTETTGLQVADGHKLIEIGCIELIDRRFTGKRYHQYINPLREIDKGALAVHGLTNEFLEDKPIFADIAPAFIEFISNSELIIHNAAFDVSFINHELKLIPNTWQKLEKYCHIIDSLAIARQLHMGQKNNLDALCKRYGIDNSKREFHGALLDAHLLAQVYLAMTGGQSSLFEEPAFEEKKLHVVNFNENSNKRMELVTLYATEEELSAHEATLQNIAKKGNCIWLNIDE